MICALLAGAKTQTRRPVKPKHAPDALWGEDTSTGLHRVFRLNEEAPADSVPWWNLGGINGAEKHCPYGQPGDQLWVRETWAEVGTMDPGLIVYRADYPACVPKGFENVPPARGITWKPSIHMFRRHSRITLEIVSVRVERLQDISEADAIAEGIESLTGDQTIYHWDFPKPHPDHAVSGYQSARSAYQELWCEISGCDSYDANPWVWAVEFRRIEQ